MSHPDPANPGLAAGKGSLREANAQATKLLRQTIDGLLVTVQDEPVMEETPLEVWAAIHTAIEALHAALRMPRIRQSTPRGRPPHSLPTALLRQQGQFPGLSYANT